jgi:hypothetical protein
MQILRTNQSKKIQNRRRTPVHSVNCQVSNDRISVSPRQKKEPILSHHFQPVGTVSRRPSLKRISGMSDEFNPNSTFLTKNQDRTIWHAAGQSCRSLIAGDVSPTYPRNTLIQSSPATQTVSKSKCGLRTKRFKNTADIFVPRDQTDHFP